MHPRITTFFALLLLLVIAPVTSPAEESAPGSNARSLAETMQSQRRALAVPTDFFSPFVSVGDVDEIEIFVVSQVSFSVVFELTALNSVGEVLPLGSFELEPQSHVSLSLGEPLHNAGPAFRKGTLRVSLLGDDETLQSWLVVHRGRQVAELELKSPSEIDGRELLTFWDAAAAHDARPEFYFVNVGESPLSFAVTQGIGGSRETREGVLDPGQRYEVAPRTPRGWLRVSHDGEPGSLIGAGLLAGGDHLSVLPVFTPSAGDAASDVFAIRVPLEGGVAGTPSAVLTLFNTASEDRIVRIDALDPASGVRVLGFSELARAGRVTSIDLGRYLGSGPPEVRLRVSTDGAGLLVSGTSTLSSGEVLDMALFREQEIHFSGIYPLPRLDANEVFTTIVNLGDEDSTITAQISWEGGTYAFGPVVVGAGASYRLDMSDLVARQEPDLLGRTLDPDFRRGHMHWSVKSGSRALIGRTEVRPLSGRDAFGFNCFGCCEEFPVGTVVPDFVDFLPGQTPLFQSCVTYHTCTGVEGPYLSPPITTSVPAPFTWDGVRVAATDAAQEDLTFTGQAEQVASTCAVIDMPIVGSGGASTCKSNLRKIHKPSEFWDGKKTCVAQVGGEPSSQKCTRCQACCNQILAYRICSKKGILTANPEHQACLTNCGTDVC